MGALAQSVPIHVKRAAQNDPFGINTFQSWTPEWWSKQVGLDTLSQLDFAQIVPNLDFSAIVPQAQTAKRYKRAAQNDAFDYGMSTFQSWTPEWWSKQVVPQIDFAQTVPTLDQIVPNLDFSAIVPQAQTAKRYKRAAQND